MTDEHHADLSNLIAFEDEIALVDWIDTPRGAKVTFLLPGEYAAHPFKPFREGTRFFARMIELDDQDRPVDQAKRDEIARLMEKREGRGGRLSKEAALLCKNVGFHKFVCQTIFALGGKERVELAEVFPHSLMKMLKDKGEQAFDEPEHAETLCTYYIYHVCGIRSRRELDRMTPSGRDPKAVTKYHAQIVEPWYAWRVTR